MTPYHTQTPQPTDTVTGEVSSISTNTPLPLLTPTPRIHRIQSGEDLGGIAYLYGVNVSKILEYNPDIDPYLLSIGTELIIPPLEDNSETSSSVPTPVVTRFGEVNCYEDASFGFWCIAELYNEQPFDIEGISAAFIINNEEDDEISKKIISSPLKRVRQNTSMPLAAYFPMNLSNDQVVNVYLLSALAVEDNSLRYATEFETINMDVSIIESGKAARVSGTVRISSNQQDDNKLWILLVAYDEVNKIAGIRLWNSDQLVEGDQEVDFSLTVYSVNDEISHVELIEDVYP